MEDKRKELKNIRGSIKEKEELQKNLDEKLHNKKNRTRKITKRIR